jgi:ribosome biogenesis GTPase
MQRGEVVKLDRSLPLVRLESGQLLRCKHATAMVKGANCRAVIGDIVDVELPSGHDTGVIVGVRPRRTQFVRKDPTERAQQQVLAANFDQVVVAQPAGQVNMRRLERELVLAFETGAKVAVVLTKSDLGPAANVGEGSKGSATQPAQPHDAVFAQVSALAGPQVEVRMMSAQDAVSVARVRELFAPGTTTVLIGRSGVGKSTLVNILSGQSVRKTSAVRATDGKGRHTTVSREIIELPGGGRVVDMPGVRGLGMWEATEGIGTTFADIEAAAQNCKFRDCKHIDEPGCAVKAAVENGEIAPERYTSYLGLCAEVAEVGRRREEARWAQRDTKPRAGARAPRGHSGASGTTKRKRRK